MAMMIMVMLDVGRGHGLSLGFALHGASFFGFGLGPRTCIASKPAPFFPHFMCSVFYTNDL